MRVSSIVVVAVLLTTSPAAAQNPNTNARGHLYPVAVASNHEDVSFCVQGSLYVLAVQESENGLVVAGVYVDPGNLDENGPPLETLEYIQWFSFGDDRPDDGWAWAAFHVRESACLLLRVGPGRAAVYQLRVDVRW